MNPDQPINIKTKLQVTCQNCSLTALCIPRGLSADEVDHIGRIVGRRRTLQRGEHLYHKGDRFRGIFAIKAGTAKTVTYDGRGHDYITGFMLPGELLGFDALSSDHHKCSAIALETLSYCELPGDQLDDLCRQVPNLLRELFRHAGARLDEETELAIIGRQPADERVAAFLLDLSERLGKRGFSPVQFRLSLTRQEIGNYLGLALETVSRTFRALQTEGLLEVHQKQVLIKDLEGLRRICGHSP